MIRACVAKADNGLDVMLNDVFLQKFRKGIVVVVKNNGMSLSGQIKIVVACIKVEFMYSFAVFSQPVGKAQKKIADRALKQQDIFCAFKQVLQVVFEDGLFHVAMWFCFLCNSFRLNFQVYAKRINDAKAMMPQ